MSKENSIKFINHLYKNLTYNTAYSPYIILNVFLIVGLVLYIVYINVMKNVKYYKDNWETEKCNPSILPFAGFINKPEESTIYQFTGENFQYCVQNVIKNFSGAAIDPIYYIVNILTELYSTIASIVNKIRELIDYIRTCMTKIFGTTIGKITNISVSLRRLLILIREQITKTMAVLITLYYFIQSVFYTTFSAIGTFTEAVTVVLVVLTILIIVLTILAYFAFTEAPRIWIMVILYSIMYVLVAIPLIMLIYLMVTYFPQYTSNSCFDKNTIFKLSNGREIPISQLKIGDILDNGSIIHCHLTLDASNETMYKLDNIIVSGTHPVLYNNQWITVSLHPNVEKIINYPEKNIYCLNTSNKKIIVNNTIFSDWDDVLNENRFQKLLFNFKNKNLDNIHKYYDKGFESSTKIKMMDGNIKSISEINVGDILDKSIKVYGIVKIKSDDLINGNLLNNHHDKHLGDLYNLLTNTGYFYINNLKYNDFNSCIDRYLNIF